MIIYYAIGGGLGHLTRAKKILKYKNILDYKVITAIPNNPVFRKEETILFDKNLHKSPEIINSLITDILRRYNAEALYIDTFPFGILGELDLNILEQLCPIIYVARYLKWQNYLNKIKQRGQFHATILFDMTGNQQLQFIESRSKSIESIKLPYLENGSTKIEIKPNPTWLINHSGDKQEVLELFEYAKEVANFENVKPHFMINTQCNMGNIIGNNVSQLKIYPATVLYKNADKIITACGFNVMHETLLYHKKHKFIPFPRRYDDQFKRAEYRAINKRNAGSSST